MLFTAHIKKYEINRSKFKFIETPHLSMLRYFNALFKACHIFI
jgi:hypothetical protein